MNGTRLVVAAILAGLSLTTGAARASRNDCFYNGVALDDRVGPPKDFTGEYTCKDSDTGKVVLRQHQLGGKPDGDYTKYDFKTGEVEETGHYREGKLDGQVRRFKSGVVYIELNYVGGKHQGVQRDFKDGKVSRVYLVTPDGRPDTSYQLNKQGQLTSLSCRTRPIGDKDAGWCGFNGKQSTVTLYDEQGRVRATEQYVGGKEHGLFKKLNVATGAVMEESHWENGKHLKAGEQFFNKQGAAVVKTDCDDKRATCTETAYFDGGKQVRTVIVRTGARVVKRTEYYQNGKPQEEMVAAGDAGKVATRYGITRYYDDGQIAEKGSYLAEPAWFDGLDYLRDGVVESYRGDGTLRARETYARGRLQGRAERFGVRDDGKKVREEAEYDKNTLVRQKVFLDGKLVEESEFFPDGSTKAHKSYPLGEPGTKI